MVEDIGYVDENNIFHKNMTIPENKSILPYNKPVPPPQNKSISQPNKPIPPQRPQRKKISYDDLLSNMGIQLIDGKLELYNKNLIGQNNYSAKNTFKNADDYYYKMNRTNQNNIIQRQPFQQQRNQQQPFQQQPFQQQPNQQQRNQQQPNQQQPNQQQPFQQQRNQQQPKTKEQYKQYLRFQYLKQQKERERINQIKSKKIQFTNPNALCQLRGNAPNFKLFRFVGQK